MWSLLSCEKARWCPVRCRLVGSGELLRTECFGLETGFFLETVSAFKYHCALIVTLTILRTCSGVMGD